jgi:hypothetical protein
MSVMALSFAWVVWTLMQPIVNMMFFLSALSIVFLSSLAFGTLLAKSKAR